MKRESVITRPYWLARKALSAAIESCTSFYNEKLWFAPGNRPLEVYTIGTVTIGIMICFDWFFPEVARALAVKGADILCHPANLVLPYCPQAMITRCIENRVFAITANRIGTERRTEESLSFIGTSQILGTKGEILYRASPTGKNRWRLRLTLTTPATSTSPPLTTCLTTGGLRLGCRNL